MVDVSSPASDRPRHLRAAVWWRVALGLGFLALMILPVEAVTAWALGALAGSAIVAWGLAALLVLPTAYWLLGSGLAGALAAEWDAALDGNTLSSKESGQGASPR